MPPIPTPDDIQRERQQIEQIRERRERRKEERRYQNMSQEEYDKDYAQARYEETRRTYNKFNNALLPASFMSMLFRMKDTGPKTPKISGDAMDIAK